MVTRDELRGKVHILGPSAEVKYIRTPDRADPKDEIFPEKETTKIKNSESPSCSHPK